MMSDEGGGQIGLNVVWRSCRILQKKKFGQEYEKPIEGRNWTSNGFCNVSFRESSLNLMVSGGTEWIVMVGHGR